MDIEITPLLAKELVLEQFPQWSDLSVKMVEPGGVDNRTFRLGQDMLIRMPSASGYALQAAKEQKWLPALASHLSVAIPKPIAMGQPSKNYPWEWSIYQWIEGESVNNFFADSLDLQAIALQLAQFLNELHKIDTANAPKAGAHNYYRGCHPLVYDNEVRAAIVKLKNIVDTNASLSVWEKAINSKWKKDPVWIHGDLSSGNILLKNQKLTAVIDFGCMGVGDPACDLVIAWTLLKNDSRNIFKSTLHLDKDSWNRAKGWALWKALITASSLKDRGCAEFIKQQEIIDEVLKDNG